MDVLPQSLNIATIIKLSSSLAALLLVMGARALIARALYRRVSAPELRRRWLASVRNGLFILFVLP